MRNTAGEHPQGLTGEAQGADSASTVRYLLLQSLKDCCLHSAAWPNLLTELAFPKRERVILLLGSDISPCAENEFTQALLGKLPDTHPLRWRRPASMLVEAALALHSENHQVFAETWAIHAVGDEAMQERLSIALYSHALAGIVSLIPNFSRLLPRTVPTHFLGSRDFFEALKIQTGLPAVLLASGLHPRVLMEHAQSLTDEHEFYKLQLALLRDVIKRCSKKYVLFVCGLTASDRAVLKLLGEFRATGKRLLWICARDQSSEVARDFLSDYSHKTDRYICDHASDALKWLSRTGILPCLS